ncbi:uncharacterized protein LOC111016066 [Momordica charantia]|uniref:Uncharacterized protein LOC111016066 n=1 Tax=Momordica charantia TaxID=3673 RepID=A0A6J1CZ03_MOMCH|nr:uncharacterized protein LOC111016066 [Momordica charantia]
MYDVRRTASPQVLGILSERELNQLEECGFDPNRMKIINLRRSPNLFTTVRFLLILGFLFSQSSPTALAKSRRPVTDAETKQKKQECYTDIESGLWGWNCKSSAIEKENCALRCLSPTCYDLVYGSDPLEEGEKDLARSQEYKYCIYKLSMGESLEGIKGSFDY